MLTLPTIFLLDAEHVAEKAFFEAAVATDLLSQAGIESLEKLASNLSSLRMFLIQRGYLRGK